MYQTSSVCCNAGLPCTRYVEIGVNSRLTHPQVPGIYSAHVARTFGIFERLIPHTGVPGTWYTCTRGVPVRPKLNWRLNRRLKKRILLPVEDFFGKFPVVGLLSITSKFIPNALFLLGQFC